MTSCSRDASLRYQRGRVLYADQNNFKKVKQSASTPVQGSCAYVFLGVFSVINGGYSE